MLGVLVLTAFVPLHRVSGVEPQFKIVEEKQVGSSFGAGSSAYLAAKEIPGPTQPVVVAGRFETEIFFPSASVAYLAGGGGVPSVFAGVFDENAAVGGWAVQGSVPNISVDKLEPKNASSTSFPSAELLDLAVVDRNQYYVTGHVNDTTYFQNRLGTNFTLGPAPAPPTRGFIAVGKSGTFQAAHFTDATMQPWAVSSDTGGSFLVIAGQERDAMIPTYYGDDARVHRYNLPLPLSGLPLPAPVSISDTKLDATDLTEVVVNTSGRTWVGGTKDGTGRLGGPTDVWFGIADFASNQIRSDFRAGSEGEDRLLAMERGPHGEVYVAFTVGGRKVSFGGLTYDLDSVPLTLPLSVQLSPHAFLGLINASGFPVWLTPLGLSQSAGGSLAPVDLSVDSAGIAYATIQGSGTWNIEGFNQVLNGPGQITVNGKGRVIDFTPAPSLVKAVAGAVPDIESRLVLGHNGPFAAFVSLEETNVLQTNYFICWNDPHLPGHTVDDLSALVTQAGGQVHNEIDYLSYGTVAVSAWLTPDQFGVIDGNPALKAVQDIEMEPDTGGFGEVTDPGWALARLFDPYLVDPEDPSASFFYPSGFVTSDGMGSDPKKVRIYVIDKGLEPDEDFDFQDLEAQGGLPTVFDGASPVLVDSLIFATDNDEYVPDSISDHPRQIINLIAAASLGSAEGTSAEILFADPYSGASPMNGNSVTFASYVLDAIYGCLTDAAIRDVPDALPTLIVIASSGVDPGDVLNLGGALEQAVLEERTVIISAGNGNKAQAANYVPALHGDIDGVITVGATAFNNNMLPADPTLADLNKISDGSNIDATGQIISLFAPGSGVDTGFGQGTGTSYSCALVAGLAATYMSMHPDALPAEVEQALVAMSARDNIQGINIARSACGFQAWLYRNGLGSEASGVEIDLQMDSDGDGDTDLWEFLGGSDPTDDTSHARVPVDFELNGTVASLSAWLPHTLVDGDDTLSDGCWDLPITLQVGDDLQLWNPSDPEKTLISSGNLVGGLRELRFDIDLGPFPDDRCFLRFDFGDPVSP